jgi:hypothetical protein
VIELLATAGGGPRRFAIDTYAGNDLPREIQNRVPLSRGGFQIMGRTGDGSNVERVYFLDQGRVLPGYKETRNGFVFPSFQPAPGQDGFFGNFGTNWTDRGFEFTGVSPIQANQGGQSYVKYSFLRQRGFLDVVGWVGNGVQRTISHSLGAVPGMIIVARDGGLHAIRHRGFSATLATVNDVALQFHTLSDIGNGSPYWGTPTDSGFGLPGSGIGGHELVNWGTSGATENYRAYLFADDRTPQGSSAADSYTGSAGSVDVILNWTPRMVMIGRAVPGVGPWACYDEVRGWGRRLPMNNNVLVAGGEGIEPGGALVMLPNGFRVPAGHTFNSSGQRYIYLAVR